MDARYEARESSGWEDRIVSRRVRHRHSQPIIPTHNGSVIAYQVLYLSISVVKGSSRQIIFVLFGWEFGGIFRRLL